MKKIVNAVKWFFSNPTCVFCLGMAIGLLATTLEVIREIRIISIIRILPVCFGKG